MRKDLSRGFIWPPLLVIGGIIFVSYLFATTLEQRSGINTNEKFTSQGGATFEKKGTVQIGNVRIGQNSSPGAFPTAAADSCNRGTGRKADPATCSCTSWLVQCQAGQCTDVNLEKSGFKGDKNQICATVNQGNMCSQIALEGDGWYCI